MKEAWGTGPRQSGGGGGGGAPGTLVMVGTGPYQRRKGAEEQGTMAAMDAPAPSSRPAYMAQFRHGEEPTGAAGGKVPRDIYSVDEEDLKAKSAEELETMVQELDGAFRRDMGALTQKYDRARALLVGLLEPEGGDEEEGDGEDGEEDGGIYG